ncbi:MAG: coproporphyrinogen III oxidase family protein [Treponema sp.]|jgi:oxygen-independent coproporphyrinogen-3 oxidase|nr:coproporphyrinogen III oxidase family protein [Treponema sp.]
MERCLSLYIHIPFCAGRCGYCDFYSTRIGSFEDDFEEIRERFVERLLEDVRSKLDRVASVPTVYVGGGTPSVLRESLGRLLEGLGRLLPNTPLEFTVEANPESADQAFFRTCRSNNVTRVSLGVQTLSEKSRKAVNRLGDADIVRDSLERARRFFPRAFSVDLIAGLPFQDAAVVQSDVEQILAFEPAHVSLYSLTLAQGTPLEKSVRKNAAFFQRIDDLWLLGKDLLEQAGYTAYEVSNFSLKDKESLHNKRYWRMENWAGAGPSASGTMIDDETGTGVRITVKADVALYLEKTEQDVEYLNRDTLIKESLLMGFRSLDGPDEALFLKRFHKTVAALIPKTIGAWRDKGLFEQDRIALTREGILFLNQFLAAAFVEISD